MDDLCEQLERAGLGEYRSRLVDELSCCCLEQLRRLDDRCADGLIESLRPFPGHRTRLVSWLNDLRSMPLDKGLITRHPTCEQRRKWRMTLGVLREANGDAAATVHPPVGHPSAVRVLRVGKCDRIVEYDAPATSMGGKPIVAGKAATSHDGSARSTRLDAMSMELQRLRAQRQAIMAAAASPWSPKQRRAQACGVTHKASPDATPAGQMVEHSQMAGTSRGVARHAMATAAAERAAAWRQATCMIGASEANSRLRGSLKCGSSKPPPWQPTSSSARHCARETAPSAYRVPAFRPHSHSSGARRSATAIESRPRWSFDGYTDAARAPAPSEPPMLAATGTAPARVTA